MTRTVAGVLTLLALLACSREKKDIPIADRVTDAIPKLEKTIGVPFKTPPKFEMRSKDEVRKFLEAQFASDLPDEDLRGSERAYKRFGLLPDSLDLRQFMLTLLTEQVAGFYDPATKVLYIVQGASDDMVSVTVTHELVHALQDQYFSLDSLRKIKRRNDRQIAAQAVMEGQATLEQLASMLGGGTAVANLPGGWDRVREVIRSSQGSMPVFAGAPMIIQETLLFPYLTGAEFMKNFKEKSGGKLPYDDMPVSTEQVMHEDRFFLNRDAPTWITLPAPTGGTDAYENDLGEFEVRLFLFQHLKDRDAAYRGAAGWDGDRFVSWNTPRGDATAWLSVWDTAVDAAEFYDLVDTALLKRFEDLRPMQSSGERRVYSTKGRTIAVSAVEVQGRPSVLYVDVPAGSSLDVIDLKKVKLEE
ncbi:MAG: hypothetical protein H7066_08380 [Cytophagaceae bacterium]|nr:hypothetical protein [Gemmatimonadaceae bacterium]